LTNRLPRGLRSACRGPRPQTEVKYRAGALEPTIRAVGVLDLGVGILDRLRLPAFIPRLDIAVEGSAQLCTDEHFMVVFHPMEGESRRKTDVHIDVSLELWTKGTRRIAVLELRDAAAVRRLRRGLRWIEPLSPGASLLELPQPLLLRLLGHVPLLLLLGEDLYVELVRQLDIPVDVFRPGDEVLCALERKDDDLRLLNREWRVLLSPMPGLEELPHSRGGDAEIGK